MILNEARRRGIPVYPPHVNASGLEYLPESEGIRVPLTGVIVGPETARKIKVPVSRRVLEMLLLSGALEGLDESEKSGLKRSSRCYEGTRPSSSSCEHYVRDP